MGPLVIDMPLRCALTGLKDSLPLGSRVEACVADSEWLTMGQVLARLRAAGFGESESTVRRMVDDGELESYRRGDGQRGHRRVSASSVDAWISQRRPGSAS